MATKTEKKYSDYVKVENDNLVYYRKTPSPLNSVYKSSHLRYPLMRKTDGKAIHEAIREANILAGLKLIDNNTKIIEIKKMLNKDNGVSVVKNTDLEFIVNEKVKVEDIELSNGCVLMDLNRWVSHFLKFGNLSKASMKPYTDTYAEFFEYIKGVDEVELITDIKAINFEGFIEFKKSQRKYKDTSLKSFLGKLKGLFKHISAKNKEEYSFATTSNKYEIIVPVSMKEGLTEPESKRLLRSLSSKVYGTDFDKITTYRNRLMIKLGLLGGLRASEILSIRIDNFQDMGDGQYKLNFIGKGSKARTVYINKSDIKTEFEALKNADREWVAQTSKRRQIIVLRVKGQKNQYINDKHEIFVEDKGSFYKIDGNGNHILLGLGEFKNGVISHNNVIDRKNLWTIATKAAQLVGIKKSGVHVLRHTMAEKMVNENVNLKTIQKALGHSSLKTTDIYAKTNEENTKDAFRSISIDKDN